MNKFAAIRKILFILVVAGSVFVLAGTDAIASHFRYGTINWKRTGVANQVQFNVTLSFRRSFSSAYQGPIGGTFFGETLDFGDGTRQALSFTIKAFNISEDWVIGEATVVKTYGSAGPFTAFINDTARILNLNNRANQDYHLETLVSPAGGNDSPVTSLAPIVKVIQSGNARFTVPAVDAQGDTLRFRFATEFEAVGNIFVPPASPPGMSIDSNTGEVTWDTSGLDQTNFWTTQVIIEDLDANNNVKSKIPVDFLLKISAPVGSPPALTINPAGPLAVNAGEPVSFTITATDPDPSDAITLANSGLPNGATTNAALPLAGPSGINSTFSWTPINAQAGLHSITFIADDGTGGQALSTVNINVTIVDAIPPTIQAPPDLNFTTPPGDFDCDMVIDEVTLGTPIAGDNKSSVTVTRTGVPVGNDFNVGTTIITYTATDSAGNTASDTQTVIVRYSTPLTVTAPPDANYYCLVQVPAADPSQATTPEEECLTPSLSISESDNGGAGTPASPLIITRTFTATNSAGEIATDTQTITVSNTAGVNCDCTYGSFGTAQHNAVGTSPNSVAHGDFNGDGKTDLAVSNNNTSNVSVLLGNGDGTFQPRVNYSTATNPQSVALADFNGDGRLDIVTANRGSNNVSVLLGNGDGTFQTRVNYGAATSPRSVVIGDFNGDGKLDLAVANATSNNVSVLLGNGNGTFQTRVNYGAGSSPIFVALGDFNGDGKKDLATANSPGTTAILLGNGNGTFQAAVNYSAGSSPQAVAVGDLNGDGKPDLAVANFSNNVSVLLGNGDGTFQPALNNAVLDTIRSVAVGDLNGDGKTDLVMAASASALGLMGKGDGTFQQSVGYSAGTFPRSAAVGDFNADGKSDLVVVNQTSANVSILLNTLTSDCTITSQPTITTVQNAGATYSPLDQTILLAANVSGVSPVNQGMVTFTVRNSGGAIIGSPVTSGPVTTGNATAVYVLPGGTSPQTLSINAEYTDSSQTLQASSGTGVLTVKNGATIINWNNPADIGYGTPLDGAQLNATANVAGTFTYTPSAGTVLHAGNDQTLHVEFTPADASYDSASMDVDIDVSKATLTITVDDTSREYGDPNPPFTYSVSGFVNDDTSSLISGAPEFNTAATQASYVGGYSASLSTGTLNMLADYNYAFIDGTLTVTTAALIVTTDDKSKTYGDPNPALTGSIAGLKNGDDVSATYSTTANQSSGVGDYAITATLLDPANKLGNYSVTNDGGALTIMRRPLTILADDKSRVFNTANPSLTFTPGGFANDDTAATAFSGAPDLSTTALITSNVGTYPITVATGSLNSSNYSFVMVPGTLMITQAGTTTVADNAYLANNQLGVLSVTLRDSDALPISGRSLTLTLGSGAAAQSCNAVTDALGKANCQINPVVQPLGAATIAASFTGDLNYLASIGHAQAVVYAFAAGNGSFVIGDRNAVIGNKVTFWGAQWSKMNQTSGDAAPSSFKGFANRSSATNCGSSWTSDPGNSSPPGDVPSYLAVFVSTSITKTGSTIDGNISMIAIVRTNPGYGSNPGHAGTGTVVAIVCQ